MRCLLSGFLFVLAVTAHAAEFLPFRGDSRAVIEQAHAGQAMILTFWSVDCAYCADDLALLGDVVRRHPQIALVTVNTDDDAAAGNASKMLNEAGLPVHARWRFAGHDIDRLRYQVDRKWYGELPRTYFYDTRHQVRAVSGKPAAEWLEGWLQDLKAARP